MKNIFRKTKFLALLLAFCLVTPAFAYTTGSINYREVMMNYSKAKAAQSEIEDRANELQRFLLDKEKDFKKIESPIQKKTFEEQTAKAFAQKQDAYQKFKLKKEKEIDFFCALCRKIGYNQHPKSCLYNAY